MYLPQPDSRERSDSPDCTGELAVMPDTFAALGLSQAARDVSDPDYPWTWASRGDVLPWRESGACVIGYCHDAKNRRARAASKSWGNEEAPPPFIHASCIGGDVDSCRRWFRRAVAVSGSTDVDVAATAPHGSAATAPHGSAATAHHGSAATAHHGSAVNNRDADDSRIDDNRGADYIRRSTSAALRRVVGKRRMQS